MAARKLAIRLYWMLRAQERYPEIVRVESKKLVEKAERTGGKLRIPGRDIRRVGAMSVMLFLRAARAASDAIPRQAIDAPSVTVPRTQDQVLV